MQVSLQVWGEQAVGGFSSVCFVEWAARLLAEHGDKVAGRVKK